LRRPRPVLGWPWVVGAVVFASLAAPPLLSGQASVAGYIKLDDSAIWLGLIAHLMEHGRDIGMVPPSTFQLDLVNWIGNAYPVGAFMPVGVTAKLTGQDYANAYQPVICVLGAIGALGLYGCVRELVERRGLAALAAIGGAHASLYVGYAQWGSIKEIAAVALIPALIGPGVAARNARGVLLGRGRGRWRRRSVPWRSWRCALSQRSRCSRRMRSRQRRGHPPTRRTSGSCSRR
jgi:hypothetical protein